MVGRLLVGFVWLNLQFFVSWLVDFQWASCVSIFSFLCYGWQTFSGVPEAQSFVFCVMVGRLLVGFVWLNLQFSVSWQVDFQWGSCGSIFSFLCHGRYTFSGVRVAQSLAFCVMVGKFLVGFVWLNLQFFVSWQVDFQWAPCVSIFSFLCYGWQTFSGVRVAQSFVFCVMVSRLLVGFVCLNLQFSLLWLVDFQWGSCGPIFCFLCHGRQTFSGLRVSQSLVFCVMVGRLLVGFVWLKLQFSVSWLVDFQWVRVAKSLVFCVMVGSLLVGSCGSVFNFLCHGWQTFSGVRVAQSLVFCVMVGRLLVGFAWLNLQFSVSWLVDFQWGSCGSIFSFLCHGWQTFSGVRVAQSLVFCVIVGRLLLGSCGSIFMFSVIWLVDFWWGPCGSIFSFLCHGWQTFSGVRVAQSLVFCVMVGRLLVGFVWLNLQFSVSWLVDFQWDSCGSIFRFLCHGWQTFSGVRVAQSLVFCVMVGRLLVGFLWPNLLFSVSWQVDFQWASCVSIFSFLCHGWQTFSGFVWLNHQFSVSWLVDFQWASCCSIFRFLCHGWQTVSGFVWLNLQISVSWLVDFQLGSCGSIFCFLCPGWQTFSGVRVAQSLVFCVMVGRLLVGFVWLNLQFSVSWQVDFQWGSCVSIFSFLCYGWQTFSGVRVAQSFVFCVMVSRLLVGFVCLNLQFSVLWLVDFQWGSCGPIFCFLCHGRQTFSGLRVSQSLVFCVMVGRLLVGFVWLKLQFSVSWLVDFQWVRVAQSLVFCVMVGSLLVGSCGSVFNFLCHGWQTFSGVRVAQSLVFCVMVGRLLVGFAWLNLQFSVSWLVDFQWGSCGSIFSFLCHGWQTFSGVRVAQSLVFCVIVGRLLLGSCGSIFMFSVIWLVDFWWGPCGSIFSFLCHGWQTFRGFVWLNLQFSVSWLVDFQWGSCGSIFSFLCHGWQTFSGIRVAQSLDSCVMVGRLLVGFVCLNLQFSVSWLVDIQWVRVAQSLVFCVMVGRLLVGFVWLNLQISVSWLVDCQWVRVAQSLDFCVMVGRLLVGFVWLNLLFFVSWLVDLQWGSCGSIFSFLCHGRQTFSGVRVAQSLVFCVMVGRLLVGFVWLNLQLSVSWLVNFQWGSCGSIFSFLCHGRQTFSGLRVSQSLVFCVMIGRLLVGFLWPKLLFSVSWLVDFQWGSCGSIFCFLCHGWQTFSGVHVAQSLVFCVMVGRLLVGFVWLNLQLSVSWLVNFQWGSFGSIFSFLCHGRQIFSGLRVSQSLVFCVMVGRLLVGFVWLNLLFSVSWLVDFQWASYVSIFSFLCYGWQTFSGVSVAQSFVFCVMVGRLLEGFVCLNLQFSVSWLVDFYWVRVAQTLVFCVMVGRLLVGSCGSIFSFLCHGWQTFCGVRVAQSLVFCVMVGRLLVGFVWLNLQFSVSWLVDFQWGSCGSIFSFLCHGWQTFSGVRVAQSLVFFVIVGRLLLCFLCHGWQTFGGVRVAQSLVFCVMVGRLLVGFVWLNL